MDHFELVSEYAPTGDQPQAIATWSKASRKATSVRPSLASPVRARRLRWQMSSQQLNKPTLIIAHNKTLAAQLYGEFKEFFPNNAVEYFVS